MWSVMATSAGGSQSILRPPAALVRNRVSPPSRLKVSIATAIARGIAVLVIMAAALEQRDALALQFADHEAPAVAGDGRLREAGDIAVGDDRRVLDLVGQRAEAGAEHEGERGQRGDAARGEGGERCVHVINVFSSARRPFEPPPSKVS